MKYILFNSYFTLILTYTHTCIFCKHNEPLSLFSQMIYMDINAEKKYFSEALCFFHETQWLHNIPVTEILTKASLDAIPKEWMKHLQVLEIEELNNFVVEKTIKVS